MKEEVARGKEWKRRISYAFPYCSRIVKPELSSSVEWILSPWLLVQSFKAANSWNKARAHRFPREWILSFSYLWLRIVKEYLSSSSTSLTLWKSERKESALPQKSGISVPRGMNLVWVFFLLSLCLFRSRVSRSPVKQLTPEIKQWKPLYLLPVISGGARSCSGRQRQGQGRNRV